MNNHYIEPKTRPTKTKATLPRILGSLVGAFIGFTSFLCLTSPYLLIDRFPNSYVLLVFAFFDAVLLAPGLLVSFILGSIVGTDASFEYSARMIFMVILFGASSMPFTVIGFLVGSYNKYWRIAGILTFVLYVLIMIIGSTFWLNLWSA